MAERRELTAERFALPITAVFGLSLLLIDQAKGAPAWFFGVFLLTSGIVLFAERLWVGQALEAAERQLVAAEDGVRRAEQGMIAALDDLRALDIVACAATVSALGEAGTTFRSALGGLETLAVQMQSSADAVAESARSVNRIATELASGSSEQAASVVEITAAMEELARTASQIAENAAAQAELAARGEASGGEGATAVTGAVAGIARVRERIASIAERAEALGARSREIFRVLDLIEEIAHETHLLSLNAAIEAAAEEGEHGRRFALVAEEVRLLARRSAESAASVRSLLQDFAQSAHATIQATDEGGREAERVLERAEAAAGSIEALRNAAAQTAQAAREIASASQQQDAAAGEVLTTLREASQVVQKMADGLRRFSDTARQLDALALDSKRLAQLFHLDSPHSLKHIAAAWAVPVRDRVGNWPAIDGLLQELVLQLPYVECMYFIDAPGSRLALAFNRHLLGDRELSDALREGQGFTERPWFRAAVAERRTILTAPFVSLLSQEEILTAATPIYAGDKLLGVLGVDVNIDAWTKR